MTIVAMRKERDERIVVDLIPDTLVHFESSQQLEGDSHCMPASKGDVGENPIAPWPARKRKLKDEEDTSAAVDCPHRTKRQLLGLTFLTSALLVRA